jgi:hypothetical protein
MRRFDVYLVIEPQKNKGCVTLGPCHLHEKKYPKAKRRIMKIQNISPCKNIIFKKNPLKETKILQYVITL